MAERVTVIAEAPLLESGTASFGQAGGGGKAHPGHAAEFPQSDVVGDADAGSHHLGIV